MSARLQMTLSGLHCASCVARAEAALRAVPGVRQAEVNLANAKAHVVGADIRASDLAGAMAHAGYPIETHHAVLRLPKLSDAQARDLHAVLCQAPGVMEVEIAPDRDTARLGVFADSNGVRAAMRAAQAMGVRVSLAQGHSDAQGGSDEVAARALARRVGVALILAAPVFVLEMGGHVVPAWHHWLHAHVGLATVWAVQWALTTLLLLGPGAVFFRLGLPALWRGAPEMNSLVALGAGAAYLFSCVTTFAPGWLPAGTQAVYFESAAVIVTLILLGRWLETRAKGKSGAAIRALIKLQPKSARVEGPEGVIEVPVDQILPHDRIHLRAAERIAVDGIVLDGQSFVDESAITGEPAPVAKAPGDPVTSGTINGTGALVIEARQVGEETALAQIIALVDRAMGARLPIQDVVNRITGWFVPAVLVIAALTLATWWLLGPPPALGLALVASVSVLIIACPCAMGLATPMSIMVGTGRAAELGVFFRKGSALQSLDRVKLVAFDKTGTLTQGRPEVVQTLIGPGWDRAELLALAAAVERGSEHPIASAIARAGPDQVPHAEAFRATPGSGVRARAAGRDVMLGSARFLAGAGVDLGAAGAQAEAWAAAGQTPVLIAIDGEIAGGLAIQDPLREGVKDMARHLRATGREIALISGDVPGSVDAVASELGISTVLSEVPPAGKADAVQDLQRRFGAVAFVGDGINDAPALATADVGLAIGTGTDVAIESADVVLMSGDPKSVSRAFDLSSATMRNIKQNLFWAFAYNVCLIPVAAGVLYPVSGTLLSPMLAAGAMALSSLFVVFNALRLRQAGS